MHRFKLQERIGNGSYSQVFRAVDLSSGQLYALKIMKHPWEVAQHHQQLEVTTLKMFAGTPSVIRLHESFLNEGYLVLVFELLETNLIDHYKAVKAEQNRPLPQHEIRSIVYQVGLALQAMHRQGYAHRDIKPENVLIDEEQDGRVVAKLVDFGLTKMLDKGPNTNYIATRWYRSPELLLSISYGLSVDVFALGCLIVELYLGFEAFPGADAIDQLNKIFAILGTPNDDTWPQGVQAINEKRILFPQYEPVDLKDNIPGVSEEGLDLISRMLVNNPLHRMDIEEFISHPYFKGVEEDLPSPVVEYLECQKRQSIETTKRHEVKPMVAEQPSSQSTFILESKFVESIEVKSALNAINKQLLAEKAEEVALPGEEASSRKTDSAPQPEDAPHVYQQSTFAFMEPLILSKLQEPEKIVSMDSGQATAATSHRTSLAAPALFNYGQAYQNHINKSLTDRILNSSRTNSIGGTSEQPPYLNYIPKRPGEQINSYSSAAIPSLSINLRTNNPQPNQQSQRVLNQQQKQPFSKPAFNFNIASFRQSPVNHPIRSPVGGTQHPTFLNYHRTAYHSPIQGHQHHSHNSSQNKQSDMLKPNYTVLGSHILRSQREPPQKVNTPRNCLPVRYDYVISSNYKKSPELRQQITPIQTVGTEQMTPIQKISVKKQPSLNVTVSTTRTLQPDTDHKGSQKNMTMDSATQPKDSKSSKTRPSRKGKKLQLTTHMSRKQLFTQKPVGQDQSFCCNTFCRSGPKDEATIQPKKQCFQQ